MKFSPIHPRPAHYGGCMELMVAITCATDRAGKADASHWAAHSAGMEGATTASEGRTPVTHARIFSARVSKQASNHTPRPAHARVHARAPPRAPPAHAQTRPPWRARAHARSQRVPAALTQRESCRPCRAGSAAASRTLLWAQPGPRGRLGSHVTLCRLVSPAPGHPWSPKVGGQRARVHGRAGPDRSHRLRLRGDDRNDSDKPSTRHDSE